LALKISLLLLNRKIITAICFSKFSLVLCFLKNLKHNKQLSGIEPVKSKGKKMFESFAEVTILPKVGQVKKCAEHKTEREMMLALLGLFHPSFQQP
jgi:hypothetical protein